MKKILLLSAVLVSFLSFTPTASRPYPYLTPQKEYVYICLSERAYAYHSDYNCRGLQKCTHGIIRTTKDSAINYYHRRPCKFCYGNN